MKKTFIFSGALFLFFYMFFFLFQIFATEGMKLASALQVFSEQVMYDN